MSHANRDKRSARRRVSDRNLIGAYRPAPIIPVMPSLTALRPPMNSSGLKAYYQSKIESAELTINHKTQNLRRLEAQRNALNARGKQETCRIIDMC